MAANQPDLVALQELIAGLQLQVNNQAAALAAAAVATPPPMVSAPVVFARSPGMHKSNELLDFKDKVDLSLFKSGCNALFEGDSCFDGTATSLTVFLTSLGKHATEMGWSDETNAQQITLFNIVPPGGTTTVQINIIKEYARIPLAELKTQCARFMTGMDKDKRAAQNNHMMQKCIYDSLTAACKLSLVQYEPEYMWDEQICAPLLLKVLMRLATMDSVATIKSLKNAMNNLADYAVEVKGEVPKITAKFVEIRNRLRAAGAEVDDSQDVLFRALKAVPVTKFVTYIETKEDSHDDGTLTASSDEIIILATQRYNLMVERKEWSLETSKKDEVIAMRAELDNLKGQLALSTKTKEAAGGDGSDTKLSNKNRQKKDEAWKKIPPATGEGHTKKIGNKDFHWCVHHMAWTVHHPDDCRNRPGAPATAPPSTAATAAAATATATPTAMSAEAILGRIEEAVAAASRF
jgi:hypothetical protein